MAETPVKAKLLHRHDRIRCPLGEGPETVTATLHMSNGKLALCCAGASLHVHYLTPSRPVRKITAHAPKKGRR